MSNPAPGLIAGRYAVRQVLAVGGMSTVHLAEDVQLGREVALKVFRTSGDPLAAERLTREGALLARLEHPDLVRAYDAGTDEDGGNAWLALELVSGPNMAVALHAGGPLAPGEVHKLLEHVAGALAYIHGLGIVHRDVKPSNVLLTADPRTETSWRAKLADFGIAMQLDAGRVLVGDFPVGTAAYFSPEQTLGQPLTTASDVYSLGLVVLEALTGERAFPGGAVESATARLFRQPTVPGWLDDRWRALLETMTAREAKSRPTATQVRAACDTLPIEPRSAAVGAAADYDPEMWTEPATLLAGLLPVAAGPVLEAAAPVAAAPSRRRRLRVPPGFVDRFSRRALVVSSAGVLVLVTAAGGSALVAAAPAAPIVPLEQALPTAPAVEPVVTPRPVPERAATPAGPASRAVATSVHAIPIMVTVAGGGTTAPAGAHAPHTAKAHPAKHAHEHKARAARHADITRKAPEPKHHHPRPHAVGKHVRAAHGHGKHR